MSVYETWMPDFAAPEVHLKDDSYVRELSKPTFNSPCKNLAWWVVTWTTSKTVKIGGWALVWWWALAQDNTVFKLKGYCTFVVSVVLLCVYVCVEKQMWPISCLYD